jgi:hypothetical protein
MELGDVQAYLKRIELYQGEVDGKYSPSVKVAIESFFLNQGVTGFNRWRKDRQIVAAQQLLTRVEGIEVGKIDGLVGPQTRYAFEVFDGRKVDNKSVETWRDVEDQRRTRVKPPEAARAWPHERDVLKFYGPIGANQAKLQFPYPVKIAWDLKKSTRYTSCHEKVHDAAARIFDRVLDHYGLEKISLLKLDTFGGCLDVRKKRGGTSWSMHSWGIAFDFDPDRNQLNWGRDRAAFARPEYEMWFKLWEEEGAISLGLAHNYDSMHTQFART